MNVKNRIPLPLGLFVIILIIVCIWQLTYCPSVVLSSIEGDSGDGTYDFVYNNLNKNDNESGFWGYVVNDSLPSKDDKDYMTVYYNFDVKNISFLQSFSVSADVADTENKKNLLYVMPSDTILPVHVNRFERKSGTMDINIYTGDMSDKEIKSLIQNISLKIIFKGNLFGKKSLIIKGSSAKDISISK